jgi:hypothetical protein
MLTRELTKPQEITLYTSVLRNLVFIISALIAFSLWLSSTISTPKRLEKLEEQIILINTKQNVLENKTLLIYSEVKETKNLLLEKLKK